LRLVRKYYTDSDIGLTYDDYLENGHQVLPFELSAEESQRNIKTNGIVTLNARWSETSIDEQYVLLVYLLWENSLSIDSRRNVILDFIP